MCNWSCSCVGRLLDAIGGVFDCCTGSCEAFRTSCERCRRSFCQCLFKSPLEALASRRSQQTNQPYERVTELRDVHDEMKYMDDALDEVEQGESRSAAVAYPVATPGPPPGRHVEAYASTVSVHLDGVSGRAAGQPPRANRKPGPASKSRLLDSLPRGGKKEKEHESQQGGS